MKKKPAPKKTEIHNNTPFTPEDVAKFTVLGRTVNNWRQRNITLLQHPTEAESVVSVGTTFDQSMTVYAVEKKTDWTTALDYAARGKVYVSD